MASADVLSRPSVTLQGSTHAPDWSGRFRFLRFRCQPQEGLAGTKSPHHSINLNQERLRRAQAQPIAAPYVGGDEASARWSSWPAAINSHPNNAKQKKMQTQPSRIVFILYLSPSRSVAVSWSSMGDGVTYPLGCWQKGIKIRPGRPKGASLELMSLLGCIQIARHVPLLQFRTTMCCTIAQWRTG